MPVFLNIPPHETKREEKQEEVRAPLWMVTMSDMTILLMTFFVLLFSFLKLERNRYVRLSKDRRPRSLQFSNPIPAVLRAEPNESEIFDGWEPGVEELPARSEVLTLDDMIETRVTSTPGGTVITVGGEFEAFGEGDWDLRGAHRVILAEFLKWMAPQRHRILVRGFTAGNLADSVVREGEKIRKYAPEDLQAEDYRDRADHWLLASLRARSVRNVLVEGVGRWKIDPGRIEVQVEAYNDEVARNDVPKERHKNRRVEVVVLPHE